MRRDSREAVYKILYADLYCDNDADVEAEVMTEAKLSPEDKKFADDLLSAVKEHKEDIEQIIAIMRTDINSKEFFLRINALCISPLPS